jgi:hypothetical protein
MKNISCSTKLSARLKQSLQSLKSMVIPAFRPLRAPTIPPGQGCGQCACQNKPRASGVKALGRVRVKDSPQTRMALQAEGFKLSLCGELMGAWIRLIRREHTFAVIEHQGYRYAVPASVLEE